MYFSEPLTDFQANLYTDQGEGIEVRFNINASVWHLVVPKGFSKQTLRDMVIYLHNLFYLGEGEYLSDWLQVVDGAEFDRTTTLTLKTVDRIGS